MGMKAKVEIEWEDIDMHAEDLLDLVEETLKSTAYVKKIKWVK